MFWTALLISWPYTAAMAAGVTEYLLEERFIPQLKQHHAVSYMGLALVILGEGIRKMAMVSACQPPMDDQKRACVCGIDAQTQSVLAVAEPACMSFLATFHTQHLHCRLRCELVQAGPAALPMHCQG